MASESTVALPAVEGLPLTNGIEVESSNGRTTKAVFVNCPPGSMSTTRPPGCSSVAVLDPWPETTAVMTAFHAATVADSEGCHRPKCKRQRQAEARAL